MQLIWGDLFSVARVLWRLK